MSIHVIFWTIIHFISSVFYKFHHHSCIPILYFSSPPSNKYWKRGTSILVWYFLLTNQLSHASPIRTLLSYTTPYSASPHPTQLPCTTVNSANPSNSAIPHPTQLHRTLLSYPRTLQISRTLLSNPALDLATPHPTQLSRTSHQLLRTLLCYRTLQYSAITHTRLI
jgi:hypothetical protein